jgi:hypothetical protein
MPYECHLYLLYSVGVEIDAGRKVWYLILIYLLRPRLNLFAKQLLEDILKRVFHFSFLEYALVGGGRREKIIMAVCVQCKDVGGFFYGPF